jgi:hypothetical protein
MATTKKCFAENIFFEGEMSGKGMWRRQQQHLSS